MLLTRTEKIWFMLGEFGMQLYLSLNILGFNKYLLSRYVEKKLKINLEKKMICSKNYVDSFDEKKYFKSVR